MNIKEILRDIAYKSVLSPPKVKYCSQTIYEALLGCCRLWEATREKYWKEQAHYVLDILLSIQKSDGGFDIGYDFNFGRLHKKGQSTSPELVALIALTEFARLFGKEKVKDPAFHAVEWIRKHSLDCGCGKIAIPYSPYTINEVMIYNGTSFACGALGCYLGQFGGDIELKKIYHGMINYLNSVLEKNDEMPGRFWYYCDQSRKDWDELRRIKIDNYHQMQQVEVHSLAQQSFPHKVQLGLIQDACDYIYSLHKQFSVVPYTNDPRFFKNQIHLWGLSSVLSGMLEASNVVVNRREQYREVASDVLNWILNNAWNGKTFEAILQRDGSYVKPRVYMVRSDAWVFNSLAAAAKYFGEGKWNNIARDCFDKMKEVDFSGPESHATNKKKRLTVSFLKKLQNISTLAKARNIDKEN